MRIAEHIKLADRKMPLLNIQAGGPGSGRRPGGGKYDPTVNTEHPFHQTLMEHGFVHTASAKTTHYYKGTAPDRTPPTGLAGKQYGNAAWTQGHGVSVGTDRYSRKPVWHDTGDWNKAGDSAESLTKHLGNVGWHKQD